jgi:8-oxo-dGTP pyrophosphatase MutT (NUDIX family)
MLMPSVRLGFSGSELINSLTERFTESLPGRSAHRNFAPTLAYGRHSGPAPLEVRRAAVAILLCCDPENPASCWIPLTLRPATLSHHGGQVCFPGGRIESGETAVDAAVREFHEELGPPAQVSLHFVGLLSSLYVYNSNNLVSPVVLLTYDRMHFSPDPVEVAKVVRFPFSLLRDENAVDTQSMRRPIRRPGQSPRSHVQWNAPYWQVGEDRVWGATAMILSELAEMLLPISAFSPRNQGK